MHYLTERSKTATPGPFPEQGAFIRERRFFEQI